MIWLLGCHGMLGRELFEVFKSREVEVLATDLSVDITDFGQLSLVAREKKIEWIINCAAYTEVDKAEQEKELAFKVNGEALRHIGKIAVEKGAKVVHFSTDYVFDGLKIGAYEEGDAVNPLSSYGASKLLGEKNLAENCPEHFIFRISWLYAPWGKNFVKTMLNLLATRDEVKVVNDQMGSPTYTGTLAENICNLIRASSTEYGIYHYSDEGTISWFDFAAEIGKIAKEKGLLAQIADVSPCSSSEFPQIAQRPRNSLFNKQKVKNRLNFHLENWQKNLDSCIGRMAELQTSGAAKSRYLQASQKTNGFS